MGQADERKKLPREAGGESDIPELTEQTEIRINAKSKGNGLKMEGKVEILAARHRGRKAKSSFI